MTIKRHSAKETELTTLAREFLSFAGHRKVFLFQGDLGAGKTTLIKSICHELGVQHGLSSPSFSIVNEYTTENGDKIFHFDLYRLKSAEECLSIGFTDYLDSGNYCLVEWPEIGEYFYSDDVVWIKINTHPEHHSYEFSFAT